jgi:hypothetical protein
LDIFFSLHDPTEKLLSQAFFFLKTILAPSEKSPLAVLAIVRAIPKVPYSVKGKDG